MDGSAQPWEVESDWENGRIRPIRRHALAGIVFGLLWIAAVGAFVASVVAGAGEPLGLLTLTFLVPGIYILFRSIRRFLFEKKYPGIHLKPADIPVAPGNRFDCVLYSGADPQRTSASGVTFNVRITANKWVERSTGSNRSGPRKVRTVMWERTLPVAAVSGTSEIGSALIGRFGVDLPEELEETSRLPASVTYDWRLEVDAKDSLPGFRYEFRLPVFDTRTALEKADHALGTVTDTEYDVNAGEPPEATELQLPVEKGDLESLRAYQESVLEDRISRDGRSAIRRLFLALKPHTHLERLTDRAVAVIHVKGDRTIRTVRRLSAAGCLVLAIVLPGPATLLFFAAAVILLAMGKAARPAVIALYADESGLQIDEVRGKKERSSHYPWSSVGMITETQFSSFYSDIYIARPQSRVPAIGARIPTRREAEGIAAAIASVKERFS